MKLLTLLLCLVLLGCDPKTPTENTAMTFTHEAGFTVSLNTTAKKIVTLADGYQFYFNDENSRQINTITIQSMVEAPFASDKTRSIKSTVYTYTSDHYDGGSGGSETTYKIWKPVSPDNGFYLEHYAQSEQPISDSLIWQLAESAVVSN